MCFFKMDMAGSRIFQESEMEISQLQKLAKLDGDFFPQPWSFTSWEASGNHNLELLFISSEEEKLVGLAVYRVSPGEKLAHLLKLLVVPEGRRKGVANLLLEKSGRVLVERGLVNLYLEVEESNPAVALYKKYGLKTIHKISNFYGNGRTALVMTGSIHY